MKKLMVLGICAVLTSVVVLSSCTEVNNDINAENIDECTLINITPSQEQFPDVFDDIKKDVKLEEESIAFESDSKIIMDRAEGVSDSKILVIESTAELTDANMMAFGTQTKDYARSDKYADEFFEENVLVFLLRSSVNCDVIDKIVLTKNDNKITFALLFTPGDPRPSMWRSFISLKKSDVFDVGAWNVTEESNDTSETTQTLIPATPGKVSEVPVEQSPDVFHDAIKRDSVLKGTSIPFKAESKRCSYYGNIPAIQIFIIRSSDELTVANKAAFREETNDYADKNKYNDEYFGENALVFFIVRFGSGAYRMSVDSIIKNHNELSFNINVSLPGANRRTDSNGQIYVAVSGDMQVIGSYIEVKKAEIEYVSNVSYFRNGGTY